MTVQGCSRLRMSHFHIKTWQRPLNDLSKLDRGFQSLNQPVHTSDLDMYISVCHRYLEPHKASASGYIKVTRHNFQVAAFLRASQHHHSCCPSDAACNEELISTLRLIANFHPPDLVEPCEDLSHQPQALVWQPLIDVLKYRDGVSGRGLVPRVAVGNVNIWDGEGACGRRDKDFSTSPDSPWGGC